MNQLLYFKFGQVGNYGSSITISDDSGGLVFNMANWAYGTTAASITATEVTNEDLIRLGEKLILLGKQRKAEKP